MFRRKSKRAVEVAASNGGVASLDLLYRQHHGWLLAHVRRHFGRDQAEDLVQDVYVRASAYQGLEVRNPRALLSQIATRAAIDRVRREVIRPPRDGASVDNLFADAAQDDALTLKQTILRLPPNLKEVFLLSRFGGLSYEEIAEQLGVSVKTVEWRMTKALRLCAAQVRT
jgi:RNA polymerase sigma factor (sigma-70 family)